MRLHTYYSVNQLTIRQGANNNVLSGDTWAVLVVGHHTETIFCVLLQPSQSVGLSVYVNILTEKEQRREKSLVSFFKI